MKVSETGETKADEIVFYLHDCYGETFMSRNGLIPAREQARRSYSRGTVTEPGGRGVHTCLCVVPESAAAAHPNNIVKNEIFRGQLCALGLLST